MGSRGRWTLAIVVLAAACAMTGPSSPDVRGVQFGPPETSLAPGQLQVYTPSLSSDGRRIRIRGMVRNPYAEPVDGVRLVFRLLSRQDARANEFERMQRTLDARVAPDGHVSIHWDVESGYAGTPGWSFELQAFAVRRGGEAVQPPAGWQS